MKKLHVIIATSILPLLKFPAACAQQDTDLAQLQRLANDARISVAYDFDAFMENVYKEPFEGGVYIVNGDTPVPTETELAEFFLIEIRHAWPMEKFGVDMGIQSTIDAPRGVVARWSDSLRRNLTYCISTSFGARHAEVQHALATASKDWMDAADVRLEYRPEFDAACNGSTADVTFDVRPVDVNGKYLARAFFPRFARNVRNLLIDDSALTLPPDQTLQLTGVLRHEVGHILGFRHEHTRPEAGKCFEDHDWQALTDFDRLSVMHYPECNGRRDWSFQLTELDRLGARCAYGAPPNVRFDASACTRNLMELQSLIR